MAETMYEITPELVDVARRHLNHIRWRREIDRAHREGEAVDVTADRLGTTVGTIASEIRKLERRPNALMRTPMEFVYEYAVGERTRDDLISTLSSWPYTYGRLGITPGAEPQSSAAWDRGTWDDVKSARASHIIDDDAFAQIARAADLPAAVFPQWVHGPTRKDPAA
ncbi:hypothetical protein [Brevibacterium sp.]|uniref:hypothetical protein n=1 Tax=Brevibacterium sp. TaxID=1701 RepID=UPI0028112FB7|nr:hypothetical protein [Brevibacterium sp.]